MHTVQGADQLTDIDQNRRRLRLDLNSSKRYILRSTVEKGAEKKFQVMPTEMTKKK